MKKKPVTMRVTAKYDRTIFNFLAPLSKSGELIQAELLRRQAALAIQKGRSNEAERLNESFTKMMKDILGHRRFVRLQKLTPKETLFICWELYLFETRLPEAK